MNNVAPKLSVDIGGLILKNPIMTASGTFGYGEEYGELFSLDELGAIVVKGTTLRPKMGNPPPRLTETPGGMLSSCGLQNIGVEAFIRDKMPFLRRFNTGVVVNVAGESVEDFVEIARRLDEVPGVHALELNVSCPNVRDGGMIFGIQAHMVARIVREVKGVTSLPVIAKLSPNVTDIVEIALAAQEAGANAIALINALWGMAIDVDTRRPKLGNITGGLTGPAIRPVAVRMVWQVAQAVQVPVIGIGGIVTADDALEMIIAGASAVQVGTGNFIRPKAAVEIIKGLQDYLRQHGITDVNQLKGTVLPNP